MGSLQFRIVGAVCDRAHSSSSAFLYFRSLRGSRPRLQRHQLRGEIGSLSRVDRLTAAQLLDAGPFGFGHGHNGEA